MSVDARPLAFLFDWDNTLVDSWEVIHQALRETFLAMGCKPWSLQEVRDRVRASARDSFPQLFGERADEATEHFYRAFEARHLEALRPLPGAEACLDGLSGQGHYLGVVSNKRGSLLRREVAHLGWADWFGALVGATDASSDKPAAEPVIMALAPAGLEPSAQVWFVGDTDIDMACAHNAGCTAVLIRREPPQAGEFDGCAPERHFGDLTSLLEAMRARH